MGRELLFDGEYVYNAGEKLRKGEAMREKEREREEGDGEGRGMREKSP